MTVEEIVAGLRAGGHTIGIYVRPDGGIKVVSLDGRVFSASGSKGNEAARTLAQQGQLSEAQRKQRAMAAAKAKEGHAVTLAKPRLSKGERKRLRRLNRLAKKVGAPSVGAREARERKGSHGGKTKDLWNSMRNNLRKASGVGFKAYAVWLFERFDHYLVFPKTSAFLKSHMNSITYMSLEEIHTIFYSWLSGKDMRAEAMIDEEMLGIAREGHRQAKEIKDRFDFI